MVPESPRWLIAVGRKEEAIAILERAAKANKMDIKTVRVVAESVPESRMAKEKPKFSELIATPELRRRTYLLCLNW